MSSDGPESPERVQINKGLVGFLTHTGFASPTAAIAMKGSRFFWSNSASPRWQIPHRPGHGLDLKALALRYVDLMRSLQVEQGASASLDIQKVPGVNHPVFEGRR